MLTAQGFGLGQTPNSTEGDTVEYTVLKGCVVDGPKRPGDTVSLNPKSQQAIELVSLGRITPKPQKAENRAVGLDNSPEKPKTRKAKK